MKTQTESSHPTQSVAIQITEQDKYQIEQLIENMQRSGRGRDNFELLLTEITRAEVVKRRDIQRNVVTMNSCVSIIDKDTSERMKFTLVYPEDANADEHKISVLSPIGTAVLGYKTGDEVQWAVPAGIKSFVIAKVDFQPEAARKARR